MKNLFTLLLLSTLATFGQTPTSNKKYNWDYVMKYVKKNKMDIARGTQAIIDEVVQLYAGESQQMELVQLYKDAYDFKIIDKPVLKRIVDSLSIHGESNEVRTFALECINQVEYRLLNKEIRDFEFRNKNGQPVKLTELKEKIVIVELWATWCGPCIKEMKRIPELRRRNPHIEFYSISVDKSVDKMIKFVDSNGYNWPIVFGGDQEANPDLWNYLNIVAIPKYFVVDRNGTIISVSDSLDEQYLLSLK